MEAQEIIIYVHGRHIGQYTSRSAVMAYGAVIVIGKRRFEAWGYGRFHDSQSMTALGFNNAIQLCAVEDADAFDAASDNGRITCVTADGGNFSDMTVYVEDDFKAKEASHVDQGATWQEHLLLKIFASAEFRAPSSKADSKALNRAKMIAKAYATQALKEQSMRQGLWNHGAIEVR